MGQRTSRRARSRDAPSRSGTVSGVRTSPPLSRRLLLQGAALTGVTAAVSGCGSRAIHGRDVTSSGSETPGDQSPAGTYGTGSEPDVRLVLAAIGDERAVLTDCLGCLAAVPALRPALAPVVAEQRQHIDALKHALTSPAHLAQATARPFRGNRTDALTRVRVSLAHAQKSRRRDALAAESGLLARLLASISASHAVAAGQASLRS
jgi:hypothetical protein